MDSTLVARIKQAARGRWPAILTDLGDIPADVLDGQHHPCPRCGGVDRFRAFDDFADSGGVFCNQCHADKNGDGISTVQWAVGIDFKSAIKRLGDYLGIASDNGHSANGSEKRNKLAANVVKIKPINPDNATAILAGYGKAKPPITVEGIKRCGGVLVRWHNESCVRFDARAPIDAAEPTAVVLVRADGKPFPAVGNIGERKSHTIGGSKNSWLASATAEKLQQASTILDVEGITDVLAVASVGLPEGWVAVTNTAGAKARGKPPREWAGGKEIIVVGDADDPGVEGQKRSAAAYHAVGAEVLLGQLPYPIEKDHGKDLRDWLNEGHAIGDLPAMAVTAEQADEWRVRKPANNQSKEENAGTVKILADQITEENHFAQDAGGKLYRYHGGVFRPNGEAYVKARVKQLCLMLKLTAEWSPRLAENIVEFIRVDSPELSDRPPVDLVNVENGMVRVGDGVLLPHDHKYLSVVQLPVRFDATATCPNIEAFVGSTFPADAHALAWEIPGVLMVPATWLQKAILLLGEGCNGKSVWLSLLVRFLGKGNVATVPLHRLEIDKFSVARLVGKLANICADLPSEHLAGTSVFKALTGGDTLTGEYKFKDSFDLEPFARLVFSANHPPRSSDSSAAFFRRWLVVPFDRTFSLEEQIPRDVLDAQLQSPAELSGLLNKALDGLRRVQQQRRFSEPESTKEAWRDFHATTDPLAVWLDRYTVDDPDCVVTQQGLRVAYNAAVEREGRPSMTAKAFGQALCKLRPGIEKAQRTVAGKLQWCYVGIGLIHPSRPNTQEGSLDSHDSRDPALSFTHAREGTCGGNGTVEVKNISDNRVNLVNAVNCSHANVEETPTHDGYLNRQCRDCGTQLPCRRQQDLHLEHSGSHQGQLPPTKDG